MGLLDEAKGAKPTTLGQSGTHFIDADTLANPDGPNYRLAGINSPEVAKVVNGELKQGTAGGYDTTHITADLANKQGFTNITPRFNPDGTPQVGAYGRQIADLTNQAGQSFTQELRNAGAFEADRFTNAQDLAGLEIAEARRNEAKANGTYVASEFDKAAELIDQARLGEGAKQQGFKKTLLNEQERGLKIQAFMQQQGLSREEAIAKTNEYFTTNTQIDNFDRDANNMSNNALSDSWELGWNGAREGAYGFLELLGETTGAETLEKIGTDGITRNQAQASEYAQILTDWKDVDGFNSGVSFLANNALMSLPYMAITAGAAVAGTVAAPVVGGVAAGAAAIAAPASIYAGQVWNEMEGEKSATIALTAGLAQAALDRIGLGAITGKIAPGKIKAAAIKKIMNRNGVSESVASTTLGNATKDVLPGFLKDSAAIATKQIADKKLGMELIKKTTGAYATGAAGEAITEAGQELIGYIAATQGSAKEFHWDELNERLIAAGIAGGALGGAFASPGGVKRALADYDLTTKGLAADAVNESDAGRWAAEEKAANGGREISVEEHLQIIHNDISVDGIKGSTAGERAAAGEASYKKLSIAEKTKQALLNPLAVLQGSVDNVLNKDVLSRSKNARVLSSILGGGLQRIHAGAGFESAKFHQTAIYKAHLKPPAALYAALSEGKRITKSNKTDYNKAIYSQLNAAVDKTTGKFDPDLIPESNTKQALVSFGKELNILSDKMWRDQAVTNKELGKVDNYLFKYKAVNKKNIHDNREGFAALLESEYKYSKDDAAKLTEILAEDPNAGDLGEAFSVLSGSTTSSAHKERSLGLSQNEKFQDFMNQDPFANVDAAAKAASRYVVNQKYLGNDNAVISKILDKMQHEDNMSQAEVDKVAAGVKDFLDAESGNYKRPTTAVGKKLQKYQKHAMTLMTLSGLPLATFSSMVELALINKSLTHGQVFGGKGSLRSIGREGSATIMQAIEDVGGLVTRTEKAPRQATEGRKLIEEAGFTDWDVGAGAISGVTEVNAWQQERYQKFFKVIGLTQFTDMTRAARMSMGADYINAKIELIANQRRDGGTRTREVQEAEEAIRNLGMSPDLAVESRNAGMSKAPLSPEKQAAFDGQWKEGMVSWVNDAIALPQAANRPLIYQDPRFALFTQFQGFISAFTANHIPKMWGEMVSRGTPAMKYSAFATMATMIMLGFLSQGIKDEIKYGLDDEDEETLGNPHLKTADYIRRGVFSSGLFGTAERAIGFIDPIYDSKSEGAADWAFDSAIGESPALSYIQRVGGIGTSLLEGDVGSAAKNAVKATRYVGPFSFAAGWAEDLGDNWNFNGE